MMRALRPLWAVLWTALPVAASVPAAAAQGAWWMNYPPTVRVPVTVYEAHFALNAFDPGDGQATVLFRGYDEFKKIVGVGRTLGPARAVDERTFHRETVVAVVRKGAWDFRVRHAERRGEVVTVRFSSVREPARFAATTAFVFSLPREQAENPVTLVLLEEDRREPEPPPSPRPPPPAPPQPTPPPIPPRPEPPLPGGWNRETMTPETEALFRTAERELRLDRRTTLRPLYADRQVVAGTNYRVTCLYDDGRGGPPRLAVVAFLVSLRREMRDVKLEFPDGPGTAAPGGHGRVGAAAP